MVNPAIAVCLIVMVYAGIQAAPINIESRLARQLLRQYRRIGLHGRPVKKASQAWNVSFGLMLTSIQEVDFEEQTIEVVMWQMLKWNDAHLRWNRSQFDVSNLGFKSTEIITPDITLYNAASEPETLTQDKELVVVDTGDKHYVPAIKQKVLCPIPGESKNITCTLKYGSWIYTGEQLNLTLGQENIDLSIYQPNPVWELAATSATRNAKTYECCPETYIDLSFNLTLIKK